VPLITDKGHEFDKPNNSNVERCDVASFQDRQKRDQRQRFTLLSFFSLMIIRHRYGDDSLSSQWANQQTSLELDHVKSSLDQEKFEKHPPQLLTNVITAIIRRRGRMQTQIKSNLI
jgi:hypothetical protein